MDRPLLGLRLALKVSIPMPPSVMLLEHEPSYLHLPMSGNFYLGTAKGLQGLKQLRLPRGI
jgi:hypothetical protein